MVHVQHNIYTIEGPFMMERDMTFDICPIVTSAYKLSARWESIVLRLVSAGPLAPKIRLRFPNTLDEEYLAIANGLGFSRRYPVRFSCNGFEVDSLSADHKKPVNSANWTLSCPRHDHLFGA